MSKLISIEALLTQEIQDLYSAENQLLNALPKMAEAASGDDLRKAFEHHLEETEEHVQRIEEIARILEESPNGKVCQAMQGLVEEGSEVIKEEGEAHVKDLALIAAAQKVEHYEIASYGTARALAESLELDDVVQLLQSTLDEEGEADATLTNISEQLLDDPTTVTSGA